VATDQRRLPHSLEPTLMPLPHWSAVARKAASEHLGGRDAYEASSYRGASSNWTVASKIRLIVAAAMARALFRDDFE